MELSLKQDILHPISDLNKSAQCAKSWESMQKYLKVCPKLRSMPKVWENVLFLQYKWYFFDAQYKFFGVQENFFERAVQTFTASLPPY